MARRTFIKVRRGILDPGHIEALGNAWYLFFYILDQADWESGKIINWKDKYAADELGRPLSMIRFHRKHLQDAGYIRCSKSQHDQIITVNRWQDPRRADYDASQSTALLNSDDDESEALLNSESPELSESRVRVEPELSESKVTSSENCVPSSNQISHTTHQIPEGGENEKNGLIYRDLYKFFTGECKFKTPDHYSREFERDWDKPMIDMLEAANWDYEKAKGYLKSAVASADKRGLSIADPGGLLKMYLSALAKDARSQSVVIGKEFNPAEVM